MILVDVFGYEIDARTLFFYIAGTIIILVLIWVGITSLVKKNKNKKAKKEEPKPFAEEAKDEAKTQSDVVVAEGTPKEEKDVEEPKQASAEDDGNYTLIITAGGMKKVPRDQVVQKKADSDLEEVDDEPIVEPVVPVEEPAEETEETPVEEPVEEADETPVEEPTEEADETPAEEPAEEVAANDILPPQEGAGEVAIATVGRLTGDGL